jgi:chromosome segregation ATPase
VGKRFSQLDGKMAELAKISSSEPFQEAHKIEELSKQIESAVDAVNSLEKAKTKQIEDLKKSLKANLDALSKEMDRESAMMSLTYKNYKTQLEDLSKSIEAAKGKYKSLKQETESFNKDKKRMESILMSSRASFNDVYQKEREELEKRSAAFEDISDQLKKKIIDVKAGFGDAAKLMDRIRDAKAELQSMTKQAESTKNDVTKMLEELKTLPTLTGITPAQKQEAIERISRQAAASEARLTNMEDNIRKAANKLNDIGDNKGAEAL